MVYNFPELISLGLFFTNAIRWPLLLRLILIDQLIGIISIFLFYSLVNAIRTYLYIYSVQWIGNCLYLHTVIFSFCYFIYPVYELKVAKRVSILFDKISFRTGIYLNEYDFIHWNCHYPYIVKTINMIFNILCWFKR